MKSLAPNCKIVSMTDRPLESTLCMWFNSRDMRMPGSPWLAATFWERVCEEFDEHEALVIGGEKDNFYILKALVGERWKSPYGLEMIDRYRIIREMCTDLFYMVLSINAPCQEFIQFNLTFSNVPRAFVDQLDRTRQAGFWEQSVRVKDLSTFAESGEYFRPPDCNDPQIAHVYDTAMMQIQESYRKLRELGMRPEHARGVVPIHLNVRADMTVNLRTLRELISKRTCFFAQGDYWRPVVNTLLEQIMDPEVSQMPMDPRTLKLFTGLPCDGKSECPYHRDLMDRLVDKSNPICPILYEKFLEPEEQRRTSTSMEEMYGHTNWVDEGSKYLKGMQRDFVPFQRLARKIAGSPPVSGS